MKKTLNEMLKAILAGIYIGVAGTVYLSVEDHVVGAFLFSFGLLVIVNRGYFLYTGKIGYLIPYHKGYLKIILNTLIGNLFGILLVAMIVRISGLTEVISTGSDLYSFKIDNLWYETFGLSILCGMMMYVAVDSFQTVKNDISKVVILVFAVMVFILSKFEHSIANMLYLFLSSTISLKGILYLILMIIGNAFGAIFLRLLDVTIKKVDELT